LVVFISVIMRAVLGYAHTSALLGLVLVIALARACGDSFTIPMSLSPLTPS